MRLSRLFALGAFSCATLCFGANDPTVFINENFDSHPVGALKAVVPLHRADQVFVEDGGGKLGEGQVARFRDNDAAQGGALEYSVGKGGVGCLLIEFDLLNNNNFQEGDKHALIFSVAPWDASRNLSLNANSKRAFGVEFSQKANFRSVVMRVGSSRVNYMSYDVAKPQHIKIWVNDHDTEPFSYERPDTGEVVLLDPDSFVLWINDSLAGFQLPSGLAMQKTVTQGNAVLGRVGFGSPSHGLVDFLIDNFYVADPSGKSEPVNKQVGNDPKAGETTPEKVAGATTIPYRKGEDAMNLFVVRPEGWKASDRRTAFIYFFGGGWTKGSPEKSAGWARWAAKHGMVGIAPDYRTKNRFGTSPLESVADGRAAFNWVVENADKFGVDPKRIVVGGSSAGGHVAIWTAIAETPPGSNPDEAASIKPATLFLNSAVTDTSVETGYTPKRFGEHAEALSPYHQLDDEMPPILMVHACDDELVFYSTAVALYKKMKGSGNECELISVPRGGHGYASAYPEWKKKVSNLVTEFLTDQQLLDMP